MIVKSESDGVDSFEPLLAEFLSKVLDHPEALVTDRSYLGDFITFDLRGEEYEAAKREIWRRIQEEYGVDCTGDARILDILRKIAARPRTKQ